MVAVAVVEVAVEGFLLGEAGRGVGADGGADVAEDRWGLAAGVRRAGFGEKPLTRMREALPELRERLPGVRLVLAAMGPKMCELAGAAYDGAFFNWMTPEFAAGARTKVEAGADPEPEPGRIEAEALDVGGDRLRRRAVERDHGDAEIEAGCGGAELGQGIQSFGTRVVVRPHRAVAQLRAALRQRPCHLRVQTRGDAESPCVRAAHSPQTSPTGRVTLLSHLSLYRQDVSS